VSIEKFGYSFGFVGNMLYMMQQIAPGKYKMTHYAFATSLMNLVLVPTQMVSGPLADRLGYRHFFLVVVVVSIPSIIAAWLAPFPNTPDADSNAGDDGRQAKQPVAAAAA
jgi:PAT family beta-lactamase induction signal transducer AmpG